MSNFNRIYLCIYFISKHLRKWKFLYIHLLLMYRLYNFYKYIQPYPDSYSYTNKCSALYLVILRWNICDKGIFVLSFLVAVLHLFVIVFVLCVMGILWGISTPGHSWSSNVQQLNCSPSPPVDVVFPGKQAEGNPAALAKSTNGERSHPQRDQEVFTNEGEIGWRLERRFPFGHENVCLCVRAGASTITRCQKQTWGRERSTEQAGASDDSHRHGREALCGWVPVCAVQGEWYVTLLLKIHDHLTIEITHSVKKICFVNCKFLQFKNTLLF